MRKRTALQCEKSYARADHPNCPRSASQHTSILEALACPSNPIPCCPQSSWPLRCWAPPSSPPRNWPVDARPAQRHRIALPVSTSTSGADACPTALSMMQVGMPSILAIRWRVPQRPGRRIIRRTSMYVRHRSIRAIPANAFPIADPLRADMSAGGALEAPAPGEVEFGGKASHELDEPLQVARDVVAHPKIGAPCPGWMENGKPPEGGSSDAP